MTNSARRPRKLPLSQVKLVSIKQECYAIASVDTTQQLKKKYKTLCLNRDFRKRASWEYLLKRLRRDGDWSGIQISALEAFNEKAKLQASAKRKLRVLTFHPDRVEMDKAAENDD